MLTNRPVIFHASAKAIALCVWPWVILFAVLLNLCVERFSIDITALAIEIATSVIAVPILSIRASRRYPYELSSAGIRAYTCWGKRRFIPWHEIKAVRPLSLINVSYLRLYGPAPSKPLWLAVFMPKTSEFKATLTQLAPINSPILAYL